ncbi:pachytene checkpoint protein 2 homolog isoform X2 [Oscarella lobularis]|uniref:pachytene checkpoint protein 2 homolog isoform X2 n=1 Tax=Oscarella lobularis TaxID=121494 RepID=UPI003313A208
MATMTCHPTMHIEICLKDSARKDVSYSELRTEVSRHLSLHCSGLYISHCNLLLKSFDRDTNFADKVKSISVDLELNDSESESRLKTLGEHWKCTRHSFYVFGLNESMPSSDDLVLSCNKEEEEEDMTVATHWRLPCSEFHGLWESLVYDSSVKAQLLSYASTALLFSDRDVDQHIVSCNRVILLHGPPGTGKTSLSKALAQKLCVRMGRYRSGRLMEINSHSLLSKWFAESGKLVNRIFEEIEKFAQNSELLVCVLIDEVESLSAARSAAIKSTEPTDAVRVVNAFLTRIDKIKKYPNVMIMTTSNVTGAIDLAFVDRADIKHYIGKPSVPAIYHIYRSCFEELIRVGIISGSCSSVLELRELEESFSYKRDAQATTSQSLYEISRLSEGFSGRTLRKLPFLAHAFYLKALRKAVLKQKKEEEELTHTD